MYGPLTPRISARGRFCWAEEQLCTLGSDAAGVAMALYAVRYLDRTHGVEIFSSAPLDESATMT